MPRIPLLLLVIILVFSHKTQAQTIRNQTLSSIGFSSPSEKSLVIHQSIGQLSVIGSFHSDNITTSQGFLRGLTPRVLRKEETFHVIPFPNSFSEYVTLRFYPESSEGSEVTVYDLNGKQVYQTLQKPINSEIRLNLDFLANSVYLVFIKAGNKFAQTRIIKKS